MSEEKQENQRVPFTYEESKLLMGCEHIDYVLYMRLKFKMDKETKLVGQKFKTSRRKLIEEMEIERQHGSNKKDKPITKDTLKACITRLERKGLVIVRSVIKTNEKRFIVELPKAPDYEGDKSVQNWNPPRTLLREPSCGNIDITGSFASVHPYPKWGMNAPYQYININKSKDLFIGEEKEKVQKKRKPVEKEPPEALVNFVVTDEHRAYAVKKGLCAPESEVEDFKLHHLARPKNWKEIDDWRLAFYGWLRREKKWRKVPFTPKNDARSNPAAYKEFFPSSKPALDARDKEIEELKQQARVFYRSWGDEELSVDERKKNKESYFECKQKLEALGVTL